MKKNHFIFLILTISLVITSCDTPEGTGAAAGAGFGAIIGGLATGNPRYAAIGAASGAAAGALIGHQIGHADERGYYEGRHLPYGRALGHGMVESPYRPYNVIDTRGIPHGSVIEDPTTGGHFIKP